MALVGYWSLDNDVLDRSGYSNNGTASNLTYTTGKKNQAGSFNGTSSYVSIADSSSTEPTSAMTLSAWINWTQFYSDAGGHAAIAKSASATNGFMIYQATAAPYNTITSFVVTDITGIKKATYSGLSTGVWYFVCLRYTGTQIKISVNLDTPVPGNVTGNIIYTGTVPSLLFGSTYTTAGAKFNGLIDEVRLYNHAQTDAEMTADYNNSMYSKIANNCMAVTMRTNTEAQILRTNISPSMRRANTEVYMR